MEGLEKLGGCCLVCVLGPDTLYRLPLMQGALEGAGGPKGTLRGGLVGHVSPAPGGRFHPLGDLRDLLCWETSNPFVMGRLATRASSEKHLPLKKTFEMSESQNIVWVSKI